jgi:hypothetical protein
MAADTSLKRYSAMNISSPWRGLNTIPVSPNTQGVRQAVMFLYGAILSGGAAPDTGVKDMRIFFGMAPSINITTNSLSLGGR